MIIKNAGWGMIRFIIPVVFILIFQTGISLTNDDIRQILIKEQASIGDAVFLVASLDSPSITRDLVNVNNYARIKSLNLTNYLSIGDFSIITIEFNKAKSGILYSLTGFSKYAAECLVFQKIIPAGFSFSRPVSGPELVGFLTILKDKKNEK